MNGTGLQLNLLDFERIQEDSLHSLKIAADISYENASSVLDQIKTHAASCEGKLTLDLSAVDMIDSSGLKTLLQAKQFCDDSHISFKLDKVSASVVHVICMSGFGPVFGQSPIDVCEKSITRSVPVSTEAWKVYEYKAVSDPSVISILRNVVLDAAIEVGAPKDVVCDIQIAVGEAITNAYRHGSPQKGKNKIMLKCSVCPKAMIVEIEDEGLPFDPDAVSIPDPALLRDHGMGIYLMRQAMDVVEFKSNNPGNHVKMIKWLRSR